MGSFSSGGGSGVTVVEKWAYNEAEMQRTVHVEYRDCSVCGLEFKVFPDGPEPKATVCRDCDE